MNKADYLFLLVKSLSKNEKIHFKRCTKKYTKSGGNRYLKLFDAINKQKQYDEKKILKKFSGEKFTKQLHVIKNYLYHAILNSLQDYHQEASLNSSLKHKLISVKILFEKGLFDSCSELLEKAERDMVSMEDEMDTFLEIIQWERKLILRQVKKLDEVRTRLNDLKIKQEEILKKHHNSTEYQYLVDNLTAIQLADGFNPSKESVRIMHQLAKHPLLKSEKNALSFKAKLLYNNFFELYFRFLADPASRMKFSERRVELIENHPDIRKNDPSLCLDILQNLTSSYTMLKNYTGKLSVLEKMKAIPTKND